MNYYLIFIAFLLTAGGSNGQSITQGVAGYKKMIFDSSKNEYVIPKYYKEYSRTWYRDSVAIQEAQTVYSTRDVYGNEKWSIVTDHYTFIDLRTLSLYDYSVFSADSMFTRKYFHSDSVVKNFPPWNFYSYHHTWLSTNTFFMPDTIINNISYKRIKGTFIFEGLEEIEIGYIRCDKKNSLFHFDRALDEKLGCPVVIIEDIEPALNKRMYVEIAFLSDTLTAEERKVFDAWERNAKLYPVK